MVQAQDVLGLGSEARMNQPGTAAGAWKWRLGALPGAATRGGCARSRRPPGAEPAQSTTGARRHHRHRRDDLGVAGDVDRESSASRRRAHPRWGLGHPCLLDCLRAMAAPEKTEDILDVNRRYHDVAAAEYDVKWGVDFGEIGRTQVLGKVEKLLGRNPGPFARSLEIGSGTGYFSLNLLQAGVVRAAVCTDVSPGMLAALRANADAARARRCETAACDAAELPFGDEEFDLVLGHAVLHHLPELDRAFAEFRRVLRPGGVLHVRRASPPATATGSPAVPKRAGLAVAPALAPARRRRRRAAGGHGGAQRRARRPRARGGGRRPRLHARRPRAPRPRARASTASASAARSCSRTGSAGSTAPSRRPPRFEEIPRAWFQYAYHGYIALQKVDAAVLEPHLPPAGFYNLMLTARKPG